MEFGLVYLRHNEKIVEKCVSYHVSTTRPFFSSKVNYAGVSTNNYALDEVVEVAEN